MQNKKYDARQSLWQQSTISKQNKVKMSTENTTAFKQIPCLQANNTVTALK